MQFLLVSFDRARTYKLLTITSRVQRYKKKKLDPYIYIYICTPKNNLLLDYSTAPSTIRSNRKMAIAVPPSHAFFKKKVVTGVKA